MTIDHLVATGRRHERVRAALAAVFSSRAVATAALAALALAVAVVTAPVDSAHADDVPIFLEYTKNVTGPRGSVAVIGDSVMLGSAYEMTGYGPSVGQMLVDRGWGPVYTKAGVGFQTGRLVTSNIGIDMGRWIQTQRAQGIDPRTFVIGLGPNEILACNSSTNCAELSIRHLLDIIGPGHDVWWSTITMTKPSDQAAWNQALAKVAATRSNLIVWDWVAAQQASQIPLADDHIHLPNGAAYRRRSVLIADDVSARIGESRPTTTFATVPTTGDPLTYRPVAPVRAIDTRDRGARLAANQTLIVDLPALLPTGFDPAARAVAVNVAAAVPSTAGYLTVFPCGGAPPLSASVTFAAGQSRSAQATSLLDGSGRVCVYASTETDVIVDLQGMFLADGGDRFTPATPTRMLDTRTSGRAPLIAVPAPAGASAVAVTITVVGDALPGFLAAFPCGAGVPTVANVNWSAGEIVAGAAFVPVGGDGTICVFTNTPADVVVDLTGQFAPGGALRFVPTVPTRTLDTRDGTGGWLGAAKPGQQLSVPVAPPDASAVTGTITIVQPATAGYLTVDPCTGRAGATASVSAATSAVMASAVTIGVTSGGRACVSALSSSHAVFDTTGWWRP